MARSAESDAVMSVGMVLSALGLASSACGGTTTSSPDGRPSPGGARAAGARAAKPEESRRAALRPPGKARHALLSDGRVTLGETELLRTVKGACR